MKLRIAGLALLLAFFTGIALAHGNKVHVRGTIEKVGADSIVVKTADGKSVEVKLAGTTVYLFQTGTESKPAKLADLAIGNRVVIHATPKNNGLEADEVKYSVEAAKTVTPGTAKPKS